MKTKKDLINAIESLPLSEFADGTTVFVTALQQRYMEYLASTEYNNKLTQDEQCAEWRRQALAALEKEREHYVDTHNLVGKLIKVSGTRDREGIRRVISQHHTSRTVECWQYRKTISQQPHDAVIVVIDGQQYVRQPQVTCHMFNKVICTIVG